MPNVALQQLMDEPNDWGSYGYDKGAYFEEFPDDMIDVLTTYGLEKKSPMSPATFYRLDEAYSEVGEDETAYGGGPQCQYQAGGKVTAS